MKKETMIVAGSSVLGAALIGTGAALLMKKKKDKNETKVVNEEVVVNDETEVMEAVEEELKVEE